MKRVRNDEVIEALPEIKHFRMPTTSQLQIARYKTKILGSLDEIENKVILLSGGTGCGKTTQIPQYIYDEYREKRKYVKIAVTQPRRIAAIGAAKRVCWERNCELPSPIGYAVSLDNNAAPDTAITFMTTGVLVEIATSPGELSKYTHIIIDEIHERDVDIDLMLSVVRDRLSEDDRLRVILMSATMDFQLFGKYFHEKQILPINLEVLGVDGGYKVKVRYLNSILSPTIYDAIVSRLQLKSTLELTSNAQDNPNFLPNAFFLDDIAKGACDKIVELAPTCPATIIVFLPGVDQILNFKHMLYNTIVESGGGVTKWRVLTLHSNGCAEEQLEVLLDPPKDKVRVVLSTNIAESSLTIKGVKFVFDFCLTKTGYTDPDTTFESLRLEWACKSQCEQRAGRTGRVNDGVVFRLVPEKLFSRFQKHITPEMVRCCVESLILKCKRLHSGSPGSFFQRVIERPNSANVAKAIGNLKQIGALSLYAYNDVVNKIIISEKDGDLTQLGLVMAKLPLSPRLVYLILLGRAFGIVDSAIEIAAALSIRQMYKGGSSDKKVYSYFCKLEKSGNWQSEIYATVNAYKKFLEEFPGGFANQHYNRRRQEWADENGVYLTSMSDMFKLVEKIQAHMKHKGFYLTDHNISEFPADTKMMFMKLAIAGAFYPRYFHTHAQGHSDYHKAVLREAGGHDPFSTVRIDKLPSTSNPEVYAHQFADYLSFNGYKPKLDFSNDSKVYVEYDPLVTGTIGNISKGVFSAICRSNFSRRIPISMLYGDQETAIKDAWQMHLSSFELTPVPPKSTPPKLCVQNIQLCVRVVVSPTEFWACHPASKEEIQWLDNRINMEVPPLLAHNLIMPDQFCLVCVDRRYWRARIISICHGSVVVQLVDCGRTVKVMRGQLRDFSINQRNAMLYKVPIKVFCCKLSCIEANPAVSIGWSNKAIELTRKFVNEHYLNMKIMYVANGVVAGELLGKSTNNTGVNRNLNQILKTWKPIPLAVSRTEIFGIEHIINQRLNWMGMDDKQILAIEAAQEEQPFQYNYINGKWPAVSCQSYANAAHSPLRQSLHPITKTYDAVAINLDDVNSILLDQTPHQAVDKFVVAAAVKAQRNNERSRLMLHNTTILPPIDGIGSLVLLIFSPTVLLRVSNNGGFFSGALCGLGAHSENFISITSDMDIEVVFSHMIDPQDITTINNIRYCICKLMEGEPGNFKAIQKSVTNQLQLLLQRVRVKIDKEYSDNEYDWSIKVDGGEEQLMGGENADQLRPIILHKLLPNAF